MKRLPLVAVLALLVACGGTGSGSGGAELGRVEGTVSLGPQCAVDPIVSPCPDLPLADLTVQLTAEGRVVDTAMSDEAGRFVFDVEPGEYVLRAELLDQPTDPTRFAKPVPVTVLADETVRADVLVDTGIR